MHDRVIVLTYEGAHRKTYDALCLLKIKGYDNVEVYATPMHYTKTYSPKVIHRPSMVYEKSDVICKRFEYKYNLIENYDQIINMNNEIIVLCGAGLIPEQLYKNNCVINAHPGYIPDARGLDAYKWSVYNKLPIGVTTHLIGNLVDAGIIIDRREIKIEEEDSFHTMAIKVYENEIGMLIDAIEKVKNHDFLMEINKVDTEVHKRMPHDLEEKLYEKFEEYKKIGV